MVDWTRTHDLILNRLCIVNQLHDCRHDTGLHNPMRYKALGGTYEVTYCGVLVARWHLYDLREVERAYKQVDGLQEVCWEGRRLGYMRLMPGLKAT